MSHHSIIKKTLTKAKEGLTIKEICNKTGLNCRDVYYTLENTQYQGDFSKIDVGQIKYKLAEE